MRLFVGTHINKVDRKGRVSVPAPFRAAVAEQPFAGIVAYPHLDQACLEGGGIDFLTTVSERLDGAFGLFDDDQEALAAAILAEAHQLAFDADGRVLLPPDLRAAAGIEDQAAFVGLGKRFQIWSPARLDDAKADLKARAKQAKGRLGAGGERP